MPPTCTPPAPCTAALHNTQTGGWPQGSSMTCTGAPAQLLPRRASPQHTYLVVVLAGRLKGYPSPVLGACLQRTHFVTVRSHFLRPLRFSKPCLAGAPWSGGQAPRQLPPAPQRSKLKGGTSAAGRACMYELRCEAPELLRCPQPCQ
jgi:hypothetical protein